MDNKLTKMLVFLVALCLAISGCSGVGPDLNPLLDAAIRDNSLKRLDQCLCELTGPVDVCCCDVETVDSLNHAKLFPLVSQLVKSFYFKFFQVNLTRACPFWPDDSYCSLHGCHVKECSEEEIPSFLRVKGMLAKNTSHCDNMTEEEILLSSIDETISQEQITKFQQWRKHDNSEEDFCETESEFSLSASYVDLLLNPERYTGYSGYSTNRIWSAIYTENCFVPERPDISASDMSWTYDTCLEKRAFYRLISGLHASINIHLCAKYLLAADGENLKFGPNLNEFVKRFDAATTQGQGPKRLKNLYFAYLVVLRAIIKAEGYWSKSKFFTGNPIEDQQVKQTVLDLISGARSCDDTLFDESQMFVGEAAQQLKDEFRQRFRNISRIMDCIACQKCRLWGKLQIQGVGTALKILFNVRTAKKLHLTRSEIVSLFNVLERFSASIEHVQRFRLMEEDESMSLPAAAPATGTTHYHSHTDL